jgi:cell division septation protein DedD
MSRSDYLIIIVVGLCLGALIFLVYQFSRLNKEREAELQELPLFEQEDNLVPLEEDTALYDETYPPISDTVVEEEIPAPVAPAPRPAVKQKASPVPSSVETVSSGVGDFMVLAGAFRQQINAEAMLRQVRRKGYATAEIALFNRGAYAAVVVDRFPTENEAEQLARELRNKGFDAYVQKKR